MFVTTLAIPPLAAALGKPWYPAGMDLLPTPVPPKPEGRLASPTPEAPVCL
jgi:hypothetical protein